MHRSLKDRILDQAEIHLLDQGYRGMRVDELARGVGISKRTLYELFRTKEEMARDALERILGDLLVRIDRAIDENDDQAEQLRLVIGMLGELFASARPPFYRDLESTPKLLELAAAAQLQTADRIEQILRSGMASGRFRPDLDPHCVRLMLTATLEFLRREGSQTIEEACAGLYDLLTRGMLAAKP